MKQAFVVVAALAFVACTKSEASPSPSRGAGESDKGAMAAQPAGPKSETDTYLVEMKPAGACKTASECTINVALTPKAGYHTNKEYPYKLKIGDLPAGVSVTKLAFARADGTFEEKSGLFKIPFTASKPGKTTIKATFSFSVCS